MLIQFNQNTLKNILYPIKLSNTVQKVNVNNVAAKENFKTTFKISALLRAQHIVILGGVVGVLRAHTLAATCTCMQTQAS